MLRIAVNTMLNSPSPRLITSGGLFNCARHFSISHPVQAKVNKACLKAKAANKFTNSPADVPPVECPETPKSSKNCPKLFYPDCKKARSPPKCMKFTKPKDCEGIKLPPPCISFAECFDILPPRVKHY